MSMFSIEKPVVDLLPLDEEQANAPQVRIRAQHYFHELCGVCNESFTGRTLVSLTTCVYASFLCLVPVRRCSGRR